MSGGALRAERRPRDETTRGPGGESVGARFVANRNVGFGTRAECARDALAGSMALRG
jgi:hypothetical protein